MASVGLGSKRNTKFRSFCRTQLSSSQEGGNNSYRNIFTFRIVEDGHKNGEECVKSMRFYNTKENHLVRFLEGWKDFVL